MTFQYAGRRKVRRETVRANNYAFIIRTPTDATVFVDPFEKAPQQLLVGDLATAVALRRRRHFLHSRMKFRVGG